MDELDFIFSDGITIQCLPLDEVEWMLGKYCFYRKVNPSEVWLNILTVL